MIAALFCAGLAGGLVYFGLKSGGLDGICACRHEGEAHMHYRTGTDCSRCRCRRFRRGQ